MPSSASSLIKILLGRNLAQNLANKLLWLLNLKQSVLKDGRGHWGSRASALLVLTAGIPLKRARYRKIASKTHSPSGTQALALTLTD
jgi:hypothetical protein